MIVATSGYYIWLHVGHIESFRKAKELGDKLVVILNNDYQQVLKYKKIIVSFEERKKVLESIKYIDEVIESRDYDRTVCKTLEWLQPYIFAKGGDRTAKEVPEAGVCKKYRINIVDGLGDKIQSSTELIKKAGLINPDWVSDCCGSELSENFYENGKSMFVCGYCRKECQPKQLHDIQITKL